MCIDVTEFRLEDYMLIKINNNWSYEDEKLRFTWTAPTCSFQIPDFSGRMGPNVLESGEECRCGSFFTYLQYGCDKHEGDILCDFFARQMILNRRNGKKNDLGHHEGVYMFAEYKAGKTAEMKIIARMISEISKGDIGADIVEEFKHDLEYLFKTRKTWKGDFAKFAFSDAEIAELRGLLKV